MNVVTGFASSGLDDIKAALAGGTLTIYSVARPASADLPVEFSAALATFSFAAPAFGAAEGDVETPVFTTETVAATAVGTPGFARARTADGSTVADFSVGPGAREIKLAEVSCSPGAPVRVTSFRVIAEGGWPERPDYYDTKPRAGYPLPLAG
jgi:hypothetical protein